MMKVKELMAALANLNPEATVLLAVQPQYPMEYTLGGVAVRRDCRDDDDAEDDADDDPLNADDVLLVEGTQRGYGVRSAWSAARRR